jgi:hypothetical protein
MATAIPFIALALSAAGAAASYKASSDETRAMNNATQNSVNQLQGLQKKATPQEQETLKKSGPDAAKQDVTQGAQAQLGEYVRAANANLTGTDAPVAKGGSANVTDARTGQQVKAGQEANAKNFGYTNLGTQWSLQDQQARDVLGNIVAQGSSIASSLPAQLAVAKNSEATLSGVGGLVGTAGSLLGTANAAGALGGGGAVTPTTQPVYQGAVDDPTAGYGDVSQHGQPMAMSMMAKPFPMYNWAMPVRGVS